MSLLRTTLSTKGVTPRPTDLRKFIGVAVRRKAKITRPLISAKWAKLMTKADVGVARRTDSRLSGMKNGIRRAVHLAPFMFCRFFFPE